ADAEVADVEGERLLAERGDLVAAAEEGIEGGGKGAAVRQRRVAQALEYGLRRRGAVRHGEGRHVAADGGADFAEHRHHGRGATRTVEPDHGGAARLEAAGDIGPA